MKFSLDYRIRLEDNTVYDSDAWLEKLPELKDKIDDVSLLEGSIMVFADGREVTGEHFDPILRLGGQWIGKIPWVVTGDTETVAFRDSEFCFAFVPAGKSVELSFFEGTETEIDEYVVEPTTVRLSDFIGESIRLAQDLLDMVSRIDPGLLESNDDCRDLKTSLDEARAAWREHELHQRR